MENNKKTVLEMVSMYLSIVSGIFGIMGISLYSLYSNSDTIFEFIAKNLILVLLVLNIIVLVIYVSITTYNKIKMQDNPPTLSVFIIVFLLISIFILGYLNFNPKLVLANQEGNENVEDIEKDESIEDEEVVESDFIVEPQNNLTPEQYRVNYYVPLCKEEIFPTEIWEEFTDDELYYTLNGIYASEGRFYKSGYFNIFEWYNGSIMPEDFEANMLNYNQHKNIANIIKIMKKRGLR